MRIPHKAATRRPTLDLPPMSSPMSIALDKGRPRIIYQRKAINGTYFGSLTIE